MSAVDATVVLLVPVRVSGDLDTDTLRLATARVVAALSGELLAAGMPVGACHGTVVPGGPDALAAALERVTNGGDT